MEFTTEELIELEQAMKRLNCIVWENLLIM